MSIVSLLPCTLAPRWMSTGKCALKDAMPIAQKFTLMAGSAMGRMWINWLGIPIPPQSQNTTLKAARNPGFLVVWSWIILDLFI